jgi:hypothetical protein
MTAGYTILPKIIMTNKLALISNVKIRILLLLAWWMLPSCAVVSQPSAIDSVVRIYPAPPEEPLSKSFELSVEGESVPVYQARIVSLTPQQRGKLRVTNNPTITTQTAFASFDMNGSVQVSVACPEPIRTAKLLPSSSGITPIVAGGRVTFSIAKPEQLTLEINGDWIHSLHLFANPFETDAPKSNDPNVIYFGPGIHEVERIQVGSGKTVYIAGGAVIYGKATAANFGKPIFSLNGSNITLRGRGIIDGSRYPGKAGNILIAQGTNIHVEGVVLRDSSTWTFPVINSDGVTIRNIKIFGWRGNSDGIDICNSRHVEVSNSFFRTFDDLVVIKTNDKNGGPSRDITVEHCVLWNEFAHALSLGAELRTPVENVLFSDCDVIHDKGREWDLRIFNSDSAAVRHIVFDNIRIEECRQLFALWIGKTVWSKEADRGHIDDVTFSNITSVVPMRKGPAADLKGFDPTHAIHDVLFDHVLIGGQPLRSSDVRQNKFVTGVVVKPQ